MSNFILFISFQIKISMIRSYINECLYIFNKTGNIFFKLNQFKYFLFNLNFKLFKIINELKE